MSKSVARSLFIHEYQLSRICKNLASELHNFVAPFTRELQVIYIWEDLWCKLLADGTMIINDLRIVPIAKEVSYEHQAGFRLLGLNTNLTLQLPMYADIAMKS